jgi:hypothetical protein
MVESARHTRDGAIIHRRVDSGHRAFAARGDIARTALRGTVSSLFVEGHMLTQILHSSLFGVPLCRLAYQEAGLIDCTV